MLMDFQCEGNYAHPGFKSHSTQQDNVWLHFGFLTVIPLNLICKNLKTALFRKWDTDKKSHIK